MRIAAPLFMITALGWCMTIELLAQYNIDPQANARVNTELYGSMQNNSVRYAQERQKNSMPMPSENRYYLAKSGMLPSEFRAGYAAVGPLAPYGASSYINYKPSYLPSPNVQAPSAPIAADYASMGSVRYSAPTASAPRSTLMTAGAPRSTQVNSTLISPSMVGSVRYR